MHCKKVFDLLGIKLYIEKYDSQNNDQYGSRVRVHFDESLPWHALQLINLLLYHGWGHFDSIKMI